MKDCYLREILSGICEIESIDSTTNYHAILAKVRYKYRKDIEEFRSYDLFGYALGHTGQPKLSVYTYDSRCEHISFGKAQITRKFPQPDEIALLLNQILSSRNKIYPIQLYIES